MKGRILLVEDEDDTRELLGRALHRAGYEAVMAPDATTALDVALRARDLDMVVTDIVLGAREHGGLELIAELRSHGVRAPVLVMTAYADVDKVKTALNEGAAHFLEKPFGAADLLAAIERVQSQADPACVAEDVFARARLTDKEREVAHLLLLGLSSSEIAAEQGNSAKTIRQHVSQIYAKCGVANRAEFFRLVYVG